MWFTRTVDGLRGWFRVQEASGKPRTGIASGDFTVTVVDPANATTTSPVVAESIKPGLYYFDILSPFLVGGGIGEYGVLVEVDTTGAPKVRATFSRALKVNTKGFEDVGTGATPADIADAVWDEVLSGHLGAGAAGAVVSRILQLAEPDVEIDKLTNKIRLRDRTTGTLLIEYDVTGILDTRVEELDG